jgi:hypothetical protein
MARFLFWFVCYALLVLVIVVSLDHTACRVMKVKPCSPALTLEPFSTFRR